MLKLKAFLYDTLVFVLLFVALTACFMVIRTNILWGNVSIEQIMINMVEADNDAADIIAKGYILYALIPALITCMILMCVIKKTRYFCAIICVCVIFCCYRLELIEYIINNNIYSKLYENEYVDPQNLTFKFPEQKRNLIILHLESMEKDYADSSVVGENLLPDLSKLAAGGISFDNFHQLQHQDYTLAGMLATYCAVPYKSTKSADYTIFNNFMPKLVCLPQVLQQNGYDTYFMKGATLDFSRTGIFFSSHGMQDLVGEDELQDRFGLDLAAHSGSSWGFRDSTLYDVAKKRLLEISKKDKPFLFSMLSLDNHGPNLYIDPQCTTTENPDKDVIRCADKMAADFINWITKQDFYKNTTIVIAGDHIKTGKNELMPGKKHRQIFNLILNPAPNIINYNTKHAWTTLDLPPTILQSIGVSFDNGKFGLGRSLFEPYPTLYEKMGRELDNELHKSSKIYENFTSIVKTFRPSYHPYPNWGKNISSGEDIKNYASFSKMAFNVSWLDTLSFSLPQTNAAFINFEINFRLLFMVNRQRTITVFANHQQVASWTFADDVKQPIIKNIKIDTKLLTPDNKLLLEFKVDTPGASIVSVGLGVESFKISDN